MKYIAISELSKYIGETVTLHGWVHALRDQKHVQFLILRNRTGSVQIVHEKTGALAERVSALTRESAVSISGCVVENSGVRLVHGLSGTIAPVLQTDGDGVWF